MKDHDRMCNAAESGLRTIGFKNTFKYNLPLDSPLRAIQVTSRMYLYRWATWCQEKHSPGQLRCWNFSQNGCGLHCVILFLLRGFSKRLALLLLYSCFSFFLVFQYLGFLDLSPSCSYSLYLALFFFSVLRFFSQNCSLKEWVFKISCLALKLFVQGNKEVGYACAQKLTKIPIILIRKGDAINWVNIKEI